MKKLSKIFGGFKQRNETIESRAYYCGGRQQNHQLDEPYSKTVFQCPMKCEGEKTYNIQGTCPVCNMHLEPVAEVHPQYYLS